MQCPHVTFFASPSLSLILSCSFSYKDPKFASLARSASPVIGFWSTLSGEVCSLRQYLVFESSQRAVSSFQLSWRPDTLEHADYTPPWPCGNTSFSALLHSPQHGSSVSAVVFLHPRDLSVRSLLALVFPSSLCVSQL